MEATNDVNAVMIEMSDRKRVLLPTVIVGVLIIAVGIAIFLMSGGPDGEANAATAAAASKSK